MEAAYEVLLNLGGGFAMAVVILILHRESIRSFKDEMQEERETFRQALDKCHETHQDVVLQHKENSVKLEQILEHVRRCHGSGNP